MTRVFFPGSFDPITKGHMNVVERAIEIFDEVVIAVLQNSKKDKGLFSIDERVEMIKEIYKKVENVRVVTSDGTAVDLAALYECNAILRGIRDVADYAEENRMAHVNSDISPNNIDTLCLLANGDYQYISSTIVRSVWKYDKDYSKYVDPVVARKLELKKEALNNG